MSLVTHGKRRDHRRKFDHEDAQRRHASGEKLSDLAREYGVSHTAVKRITDADTRARMQEAVRRFNTGRCETCGGPCMALVAGKLQHNRDGRTLCNRCRADERTERLRFDSQGNLLAVRCSSLDCANGERWQPPSNFTRGVKSKHIREGGIHGSCRSCLTTAKRLYRAKHPEYKG